MKPFLFPTFAPYESHQARQPYSAREGFPDAPFPVDDVFGLRRTILPVFLRMPNGETFGMGTAFYVDGRGTMLTADHVVDHTRALHLKELKPDITIEVDLAQSTHATVLLGYGLVFGTVVIPEKCWAPIQRIETIVRRHDDPLAQLQGGSSYRVAADIAGMRALFHPEAPPTHSLPVNFNWQPKVGERVLAVGYPELGFDLLHPAGVAKYLNEGMCAAYGTITSLFPKGRGKSRPTPGFEVETDWPSGMSGGPVLNKDGHVIGIVSSSLAPLGDEAGVAYAASLAWIPEALGLVPFLDKSNPGRRLGFGVFKASPWHLSSVFETREEAERERETLGPEYEVAWGSHQLGSDNFMALGDGANG